MMTQPITIKNGLVTIRPTALGVWLTQAQIADLFGVFTAAVNANIRAIRKSGVLHEEHVCRRTRCRDGNIVERYSLEIVAALAFRLKSEKRRGVQMLDCKTSNDTSYRLEDIGK